MATQTTITIGGAAVDLSVAANAPRTWSLSGGTGTGGFPLIVGIFQSSDGGTSYQFVRTLTSGVLVTENPVLPGTPILGAFVKAMMLSGNAAGATLIVGTDGSASNEDALNVPVAVGAAGATLDLSARGELRSIYLTGGAAAAFAIETSQDNFVTFQTLPAALVSGFPVYDARGQYRYARLRRTAGTGGAARVVSTPTPAGAAGGGGPPSGPAGGVLTGTYPNPNGLRGAGVIPVKGQTSATFALDVNTTPGGVGPSLIMFAGAGGDANNGGGNGGAGNATGLGNTGGDGLNVGGAGGDGGGAGAGNGGKGITRGGKGGTGDVGHAGAQGGNGELRGGQGGDGTAGRAAGKGGDVVSFAGNSGADGGGGLGNGGDNSVDAGSGAANGIVKVGGTNAEQVLVGRLDKVASFKGARADQSPVPFALLAVDQVPWHTSFERVSAAGATILLSTPSVEPGDKDGQLLSIENASAAGSGQDVTLTGEGGMPGSGLLLGAPGPGFQRTLAAGGGNITLRWNATLSMWIETAFTGTPQ